MEIRDRQRIRRPVPPGMLRDTYRAFSLSNVMLNPPPWHLPRRHFLPQNFPDVELRRSLATSDAEDNPGYGLYLLSYVPLGGIISLYAKDIISVEKAEELKARGNRHIRIVRAAGHLTQSQGLVESMITILLATRQDRRPRPCPRSRTRSPQPYLPLQRLPM